MAYAHFLIPAEGGEVEKRFQEFISTHSVLKIVQSFAESPEGFFWCYSVHYDERTANRETPGAPPRRELGKDRIDYQQTLSEGDFSLYIKLRDWRKGLAEARSVPQFSIFHNATLAAIAPARPATAEALREISGVGEARVTSYGEAVLGRMALN